jgi:hypothetical protein
MLVAMEKALHNQDLRTMRRYLECVNAERHDDTVAPAAFIRDIALNHLTEILLFRLEESCAS